MINNSAFTLVEFLVAIVILMVGMLGMLQAVNVAMDKNLENIYRTEAIMLADDKMMEIRNKAYSSVRSETTVLVPRNTRGIQKSYSVGVTVSQPTTQTKQVDVSVTWRKKTNRYSHSSSTAISTN